MECFTADFLWFFNKKRQNLVFGWTAGYSPSNQNISGIFLKFPNFLRSSRSATRDAVRTLLSGDNNLVPFHLRWRKIVLKSEKVSKYFVQDFMSSPKSIEEENRAQIQAWKIEKLLIKSLGRTQWQNEKPMPNQKRVRT